MTIKFDKLHEGQQKEVIENHEEVKAIVVADRYNNHHYQYVLDNKKWIKLYKFPDSVVYIHDIFESDNVFYVVSNRGISTINDEF